jgi:hypothetical protein
VTQPARSFSAASAPQLEVRIGFPRSAKTGFPLEPFFVVIRQEVGFYLEIARFIVLFEKHDAGEHVFSCGRRRSASRR